MSNNVQYFPKKNYEIVFHIRGRQLVFTDQLLHADKHARPLDITPFKDDPDLAGSLLRVRNLLAGRQPEDIPEVLSILEAYDPGLEIRPAKYIVHVFADDRFQVQRTLEINPEYQWYRLEEIFSQEIINELKNMSDDGLSILATQEGQMGLVRELCQLILGQRASQDTK